MRLEHSRRAGGAGTLQTSVVAIVALVASMQPSTRARAQDSAVAGDGPGDSAAWTTGNKQGVGTSATAASKLWFTLAKGVVTEVFYPRLDVPNVQDMQYIVTDGATFVDLERDATSHAVSMPDERSLEYTITNTDRRATPRYRITSTYVTDPDRATLLVRTTFESLDGGRYALYLLANPSMAGGGANDEGSWDPASQALISRGTESLFGASTTVVSALKIGAPHGFVEHDVGYAGRPSDCYVELRANLALRHAFDRTGSAGNVVQCGKIGDVGARTTFTVAMGYGPDAASALAAADGSLGAGFAAIEKKYRAGWHAYLATVKAPPKSVSGVERLRRAYRVAVMSLHAAEDKTFPGANVAGFATPWGDFVNGDTLGDGYHRVWGRDLYQQATGLLAAGDAAHARRMAEFMWSRQYVAAPTAGQGTTYAAGSFPRYSPVSGSAGATPEQLGCCEQLDQNAFAILLAWTTGLTDPATYAKIKTAADHIRADGPDTTERWEEQRGKSPSSIAAEVAGLIAAADIARQNGDAQSAAGWEATADSWRASLKGWTFTTTGTWGGNPGHGGYYERIDKGSSPDDTDQLCFDDHECFWERDVADYGFLELVRLGLAAPDDRSVAGSLAPSAQASDPASTVQVLVPAETGWDVYFKRYNHDNYGESSVDCSGWPANGKNRFGGAWPVLSGERGEYELANGRPASVYLRSMADAANEGHFVPEQIWDRPGVPCFAFGRPTGSAAPLNWAEGQYVRLARSMDAGRNVETPAVVQARYRGAGPIAGEGGKCITAGGGGSSTASAIRLSSCDGGAAQRWSWDAAAGALHADSRCLEAPPTGGKGVQLSECSGSGAQRWRWRAQASLVNEASGRCLDAGAAGGARLELRDCSGASSQRWYPLSSPGASASPATADASLDHR